MFLMRLSCMYNYCYSITSYMYYVYKDSMNFDLTIDISIEIMQAEN